MKLVKIGRVYVNMDAVTSVYENDAGGIDVWCGKEQEATLVDEQAAAFKAWLEREAEDVSKPPRMSPVTIAATKRD